jgi:transposase
MLFAYVAALLGVSTHSLYALIRRYSKPQEERQQDDDQHAELRRLGLARASVNADLKRNGTESGSSAAISFNDSP